MGLLSDLTEIKEDISDGVVANKVARFAYKEQAYIDNDADGVTVYNTNQDNNIPVGTASVMKVNQSIIEYGWRARASSITRMLMNHFLGRISYNLNKANDMINSILSDLISYMGQADGLATLDSNGKLSVSQLPKSDVAVNDTDTLFTAKGAFDYFLGSPTGINWLAKVFGHLLCRIWTRGTGSNTGYDIETVAYANGLWVAGSTNHGCWWSTDGKAWAQGTGDNTSYTIHTVVYANGLWVAGGTGGSWWSTDGKAWTQGTGNTNEPVIAVVYANGLWVASSTHGCWWSTDGKAWTQGTGDNTNHDITTIAYGNGLWVAGGVTNSSGGDICWWSTDGKAWTQGTGHTAGFINTVIYANGLWVAGTESFGFWRSSDGKAWTQGYGNTDGSVMCIAYAYGLWVAGGTGGSWWSTDGKAWTQGTIGTSEAIRAVAYANGLWFGVGGDIFYSTDGKSWTVATHVGLGFWSTGYSVAYGNGMWVIGSNGYGCWWSGIDTLIERGYFSN